MITFLSMWLLFCLVALVGSLSTIRKLNAENDALKEKERNRFIVHKGKIWMNEEDAALFNSVLNYGEVCLKGFEFYDKTLHDYNDSCNFEPEEK